METDQAGTEPVAGTGSDSGSGSGSFGRWTVDGEGAPAFAFEPDRTHGRVLVTPDGGPDACWHAVGNQGITATAHAGGWTSVYATSRGVVRMTGSSSAWGMVDGRGGRGGAATRAEFELNGARWERDEGGFHISRRLAAPADGASVLRVDVTIERTASEADRSHAPTAYIERWDVDPFPLLVGSLMSNYEPPPPDYGFRERGAWMALYGTSNVVRRATDATRRVIGRRLVRRPMFDASRRALVVVPRKPIGAAASDVGPPSWFDRALPWFFVALLDDVEDRGAHDIDVDLDAGSLAVRVHVDDDADGDAGAVGQVVSLTFAVGLARDDADLDRLLACVRDPEPFRSSTWARAGALSMPEAPTIERETAWHVAQLITAQQHDDYFGHRYVAQGSAYGFIHGLQGAPRDYALYAVPLAFFDPAGARDQLQVIMRMTKPSGSTYYAHTGRGQCTSGGLHAAPTDLPLFFLWALTEYVWTTGDHAFLDVPIPFWPAERDEAATPGERLALALRYVEERVGLGPHGLLRVGSGDWSDPISAMVADRKAFHEMGESGFNSAFAAYVLPRAAQLMERDHPAEAARARDLAAALRSSMEAAWTGSWFLRGWDGRGAPIGDKHVFLDGQVWALIGGIGTDAQQDTLVRSIVQRNDEPSPIGATILDRPHHVRLGMLAPGWDCNGGVWATINALLAWGYATRDPALAWRHLAKQSLAAHADAYPDVWYGIWSGPDAYNAHFGSRPGETFVQPATPMREFPVMNANAHAGPLLALLRVLGIETEPSGIVVRDRAHALPPWSLTTPLGTFGPNA